MEETSNLLTISQPIEDYLQLTQRYAHINDDELDKGYYEIFEKS